MAMILNRTKNGSDLTLRDRVSRLEGKISVMLAVDVGTFLAVVGLILARTLV